MTVRMILPDSETGSVHAGQRVTTFPRQESMRRLMTAVLITRKADSNGIIPFTFTA
jgi:hypothetical protein